MAQHKQLTWTELRVGLFVLAGAALLVVVIFYVTGGSSALGPKYRVHTLLPEVDGLTIGAPVRLDGVEIGNVENIQLAQPAAGVELTLMQSIRVDMRLQAEYKNYIRSDSTAGLITEGLLGNRYVDIDRGFAGTVLNNGDAIPGREEKAIKMVVERSADVLQNLDLITRQASEIMTGVRGGRGSIGKLLVDEEAYASLNSTLATVNQMVNGVMEGKGSLGKLVATDELYTRVDSATKRLDDVLAAVQTQQGTLGKIIYDPSFHDSARKLLDNGNAVFDDVRSGRGTLGKLATDDSLFLQYRQVGENLSLATARLNSQQGTAGRFFTDPLFYDNMSGLAGDMRLLIGDFRKEPNKFLRVKFSLF